MNSPAPPDLPRPKRRWLVIGVNVLLALAIAGLLLATWMPAIYGRLSATKPSP